MKEGTGHEQEGNLKKLTESLPVMIWKTDKNGSCVFLNQRWYDYTGQQPSEALGYGWLDALHPDDKEHSFELFRKIQKRPEQFSLQYQLRNRNGKYRYMLDMGSPIYNEHGQFEGMVGSVVDIHEQRLAELALEESETRQRLTLKAAGMGTWDCDLDSGLVACSEKTREIFGFTEKIVPLELVFDTMHEQDRERVRRTMAESMLKKSGNYYAEYDVINRITNKQLSVVANGKVFFDDNGKPVKFIGNCLDVTEKKRTEEKIRKSEERYRRMFESNPVSLWEEDFSFARNKVRELMASGVSDITAYYTKHPDELSELIRSVVIIDVNEITLRMLHAESKDQIRQGLQNIFIEDTSVAFIKELQLIAAGGGRFEQESVIQTFDGRKLEVLLHIDFPLHDDYTKVIVSLVDISARRDAERKLKESEAGLLLLSNSLPQLVWIANIEGKVFYINERVHEFSGAIQLDDGTWDWRQLVYPDDREHTAQAWWKAVSTGELYQAEHRLQLADGTYRWFLSRALPLKDEKGRVLQWYGSATDVQSAREYAENLEKEVKRRTSELQDLNKILQQSNLELQQFAHVVSHDLKEPLRKIKTFMGMLQGDSGNNLTEQSRMYAEKINSASNRMFSMIQGVLNYSLINAGQQNTGEVELAQIIRDVQTDLELLIQQTEAIIDIGHLDKIEGSAVLIHQLFYNLINNALKFTRPGIPPLIQIFSQRINDSVRITVKDNGIGFRQEFADRIFESFSRLNPKHRYEGTGLGLSLCKRIAERHGGKIEAFGSPNGGAEFVVTLPLVQKRTAL